MKPRLYVTKTLRELLTITKALQKNHTCYLKVIDRFEGNYIGIVYGRLAEARPMIKKWQTKCKKSLHP